MSLAVHCVILHVGNVQNKGRQDSWPILIFEIENLLFSAIIYIYIYICSMVLFKSKAVQEEQKYIDGK